MIDRIQQLLEQYESAVICADALRFAADKNRAVVESYSEAMRAVEGCRRELQDAAPESIARMAA